MFVILEPSPAKLVAVKVPFIVVVDAVRVHTVMLGDPVKDVFGLPVVVDAENE